MTNEKAREYFSAYSEGTLDAGLAHSFEAKLKVDAGLRGEYDQFVSMLKELEALRFEEIEVPFDLNDRIGAAVDKDIYDRKRAAKPAWTMWVRNLSFAGLAAVAIYGAYVGIYSAMGIGVSEANFFGFSCAKPIEPEARPHVVEQIQYENLGKGLRLFLKPTQPKTIVIEGGKDGPDTETANDGGWTYDIDNPNTGASVFIVKFDGDKDRTIVVVPGSDRKPIGSTHGSLVELSKAVADQFGVPVVIKSDRVNTELAWKVGEDALSTLQGSLTDPTLSTAMTQGVLHVESN